MLSFEPLTVESANLLILISIVALILWFVDLCRRIFSLYDLSTLVASGQVVRLENGRSFGELRLLWNTSTQQQLLRARRVSAGIAVSHIQVPIMQKEMRLSTFANADGNSMMRISLSYSGVAACKVQLFWGMEQGAVVRLLSRLNDDSHQTENRNRRSLFPGRTRKRWGWFGAKYTALAAVESREASEGSADTEMQCMDGHLLGASRRCVLARPRSLDLFAAHECCGMSEPFPLPAGRDVVFNKDVPLKAHRERGRVPRDGSAHGSSRRAGGGEAHDPMWLGGGTEEIGRRQVSGIFRRTRSGCETGIGDAGTEAMDNGSMPHEGNCDDLRSERRREGVGDGGYGDGIAIPEDRGDLVFPLVVAVSVGEASAQNEEHREQPLDARRSTCASAHICKPVTAYSHAAPRKQTLVVMITRTICISRRRIQRVRRIHEQGRRKHTASWMILA